MNSLNDEEKRKLREQTREYVYRPSHEPATVGFHYHFCRICHEDLECVLDECEFARETICHNCFYDLEEGRI